MDTQEIHSRIRNIVYEKKMEYERLFLTAPNYVKIPVWAYSVLHAAISGNYSIIKEFEEYYYQGLRVCPTYAIVEISDIEVF